MTTSKISRSCLLVAGFVASGFLLGHTADSLAKPSHLPGDDETVALVPAALAPGRLFSATAPTQLLEGPGLPLPPPPESRPNGEEIKDYWNMIASYAEVPEYTWRFGCSPTAAGMLFGWWDAQPGTENLFDGDASTYWGDGSESAAGGTYAMVASTSHVVAGQENGYRYGDWHNSPSYPEHELNPMSLADFMKTMNGSTARSRMAAGFEAFARWDAPWTITSESYPASATTHYVSGGWTFADFQAEIDAGYPVHLGITAHSVLALGWYDLSTPAQPDDYGYIAYTTWQGWGLREWRWDGANVPSQRKVYAATYLRVVPEPVVAGPLVIAAGALLAMLTDQKRNQALPGHP